ncbi:MAG: hypothetical protein H0X37_11865 [Herpetosiphonaceae bacterium]|nr:hypothetical protein [Herpetosiphonaceae bacterium]
MHRRLSVVIVALLALLLILPATSLLAAPQCFPIVPSITNCIDGRFSSFWSSNGGLPVFGYPITAQRAEVNTDTQKSYQTQWFERNRFEQHPELVAPYDVLLGRLGVEVLKAQGRDWQSLPKGDPAKPHYFAQTRHAIDGTFWDYWRGYGLDLGDAGVSERESLALFGYPISEPQLETNANGDSVLTQWFERARFELHSEAGNVVLLGFLGKERLGTLTPPAPTPTPKPTATPNPCSGVPAPVNARIAPSACFKAGTQITMDIFNFAPGEAIAYWLTDPTGKAMRSTAIVRSGSTGAVDGIPYDTTVLSTMPKGLWYFVFLGKASQQQSIVYFKIVP